MHVNTDMEWTGTTSSVSVEGVPKASIDTRKKGETWHLIIAFKILFIYTVYTMKILYYGDSISSVYFKLIDVSLD